MDARLLHVRSSTFLAIHRNERSIIASGTAITPAQVRGTPENTVHKLREPAKHERLDGWSTGTSDCQVDFDAFPGPEVVAEPWAVLRVVDLDSVINSNDSGNASTARNFVNMTSISEIRVGYRINLHGTDAEKHQKSYALLLGQLNPPEHRHGEYVDEEVVEDVGNAIYYQCGVGLNTTWVLDMRYRMPKGIYWIALLVVPTSAPCPWFGGFVDSRR
jgi:hypothetical protein